MLSKIARDEQLASAREAKAEKGTASVEDKTATTEDKPKKTKGRTRAKVAKEHKVSEAKLRNLEVTPRFLRGLFGGQVLVLVRLHLLNFLSK